MVVIFQTIYSNAFCMIMLELRLKTVQRLGHYNPLSWNGYTILDVLSILHSSWNSHCKFENTMKRIARVIVNRFSAIALVTQYSDVIMGAMASQITGVSITYSTVCSAADQRKHQSSASLAPCGDRWIPRTRGQNMENVSIWWRHYGRRYTSIIFIVFAPLNSGWHKVICWLMMPHIMASRNQQKWQDC